MNNEFFKVKFLILAAAIMFGSATAAEAQTTAFTYQGRFTDSTVVQPTNGVYNMRFALFDAVSGGNQVGANINIPAVSVVNGIFTVPLDYTAAGFDGTARFLEITVTNVVLSPRQEITSAPYAIRARNAINSDQLGGIDANQYVTGQVVRSVNNLTNNVTLAPGANITITPSGNTLTIASTGGGGGSGINNQTSLQTGANFNIDGTGAANIFNAATQFNIGGNRILSGGGGNIFAGTGAGTANTTGGDNAFVGTNAGLNNLSGFNNSFFGTDSGRTNTGSDNSFFGRSAGFANTSGTRNVFFGEDAGRFNLTGSGNSFVGIQAGQNNTTGANNTAVGDSANVGANNLTFATALGSGATVSTNNTVVLGRTLDSVVAPNLLQVGVLGAAGSTSLCRNAANQISTCTVGGGSGSFIDNSTVLQPTSNFNISGLGTVGGLFSANIVNSTTNFRIGNTTVFSTPNQTSVVVGQSSNHNLVSNNNAFFGYKAGQSANGFSQANTFIGSEAGELTTSGGNNSFVGKDAGFFNTSGSFNSFFGSGAGVSNKTASDNSFFGYQAGVSNTFGTRNAFFGSGAGQSGTTVSDNSFFGYLAGSSTTVGGNAFFGSNAGAVNNTGGSNAFFGNSSGGANNGGSNNAFFGSNSGSSNTTGIENSFFGSGAGGGMTVGNGNSVFGFQAGPFANNASFNTVIGYKAGISNSGDNNTFLGTNSNAFGGTSNHSTAIGADSFFMTSNTIVLGTTADTVEVPNKIKVSGLTSVGSMFATGNVDIQGNLHLLNLSLGGMTQVCRNASANLSVCSSSLRYKNNIAPYFGGLNLLNQLKPITFDWKDGGMHDLGFGAEDVEKVDKLLVIYNDSGQVEGVKYDRLTTVLVNSVKEQQTQIAAQAEQIKQQSAQIEALKQIVCQMNPAAQICGK